MRVWCMVVVMLTGVACIGQPCQGDFRHQSLSSLLHRNLRGSPSPDPFHLTAHRDLESGDYNALVNYLKTVMKNEGRYRTAGKTDGHLIDSKKTPKVLLPQPSSVPVSRTPGKLPRLPSRPRDPSQNETENEVNQLSIRHLRPRIPETPPEEMPEVVPCKSPKNYSTQIATAPPNVCDRCPDENGKNPLDPCTCVGVGGTSAGLISINCPPSVVSLDQLRDIFNNTNFFVTHVFQFTLQGSNADGALTRNIWGKLDFKYVSITDNKITDVDNGAFIASSQTLIALNLANNEIRSFVAIYNDLPKLQSLSLKGNNISFIYSEDFRYSLLTDLDLSSNQITSIGRRSFAALKKLTSLNLSYNQLFSIGDERFTFIDHDFSKVLVINLSHNNISLISDTAFLGLRNVEIDFRFNQLHSVDMAIFQPIIVDSVYYAFFHFNDNPMVCDCSMKWILEDGKSLLCFDNFFCTNNGKYLYSLSISDLGNCTLSTSEDSHS